MSNEFSKTVKYTAFRNVSSKFKLLISSWPFLQRSSEQIAEFKASGCNQSWTSSAFITNASMSASGSGQILSCWLEKRCRRNLTCGIGENIDRWKSSWTVINHLPVPSFSCNSGPRLHHISLELYDSPEACRAARPPRRRLILNPVLPARRECDLDDRRLACFSVAAAGRDDRLFFAAADDAAACVTIARINAALAASLPPNTPWSRCVSD
jgi:hypothetical protein